MAANKFWFRPNNRPRLTVWSVLLCDMLLGELYVKTYGHCLAPVFIFEAPYFLCAPNSICVSKTFQLQLAHIWWNWNFKISLKCMTGDSKFTACPSCLLKELVLTVDFKLHVKWRCWQASAKICKEFRNMLSCNILFPSARH